MAFQFRTAIRKILAWNSVAAVVVIGGLGIAQAADPPAAVTQQNHPEQFDRDGKHICGWSVMSESERAGFKSMLHNTKELADRDNIRKESCESMRKRAEQKGVALDE